MAKVFISYRREDTTGHAGRLYDRVAEQIGEKDTFLDVDTIPPGEDFETYIARALHDCHVCIVVIGPNWSTERLRDADDFVQREIGACLARGIRVVPALFDGARMPLRSELPEELHALASCQAYDFGTGREFRAQVSRLLLDVETAIAEAEELRRRQEKQELRGIAMRPHQYPIGVLLLCGLVLLSALASITSVPNYAGAASNLWRAEASYARGATDESAGLYVEVLATVPSSKFARIGLAHLLFSLQSADAADQAMKLLAHVKIGPSDWERLRAVMPAEYQQRFTKLDGQ